MINVGVVGGTGYTGVALLRLLVRHPEVNLRIVTSRSEKGIPVADIYPALRGQIDLNFSEPDVASLSDCELVFFATPNGTAMQMVPALLEAGTKVIDLAADFRLKDPAEWKHWYGCDHSCKKLLEEAVYGLPEINRDQVKIARLVANPGCYPTATTLGLLPLIEAGIVVTDSLIADCKSGTSGAGREAKLASLFAEVSDNFKAYSVSGHRHLPEITQTLNLVSRSSVGLTFVPHLLPTLRGIHATLYAELTKQDEDVQALFEERYADEPFVDVLPTGSHPDTRSVRGSNLCRIAIHKPQSENYSNRLVILSVIDNLEKGAAGQAVQNMNIMFGFPESCGLDQVPLVP